MPRSFKRSVLIAADSFVLIVALWMSFSLRLDNLYWPQGGVNNPIIILVLFAPLAAVPIFMQFGLYRAIVRYLGMRAFWSVFKAVMVYSAAWGLLVFLSGVQGVPRSVVLINGMVALLSVGGSRMFARWLLRKVDDAAQASKWVASGRIKTDNSITGQTRVVIFGAGEAGRQLAVGLGQSRECTLLAFIDDNEDGLIEAILIDENENGIWEIQIMDDDGNGNPDRALLDNNEDKKPDVIAYDYDQDGTWDKYEKVS